VKIRDHAYITGFLVVPKPVVPSRNIGAYKKERQGQLTDPALENFGL